MHSSVAWRYGAAGRTVVVSRNNNNWSATTTTMGETFRPTTTLTEGWSGTYCFVVAGSTIINNVIKGIGSNQTMTTRLNVH
mmetsp:Transcript_10411/g.17242  ORF Transcript_10411/g.17242 Transcript_10411/m.17242 type:complete len:81 (-) Transcript_10411:4-246(-)